MATHSGVLAWRIPGTEEPGGLPSLGSHRVGHDWWDLAAAAAAVHCCSVDEKNPLDSLASGVCFLWEILMIAHAFHWILLVVKQVLEWLKTQTDGLESQLMCDNLAKAWLRNGNKLDIYLRCGTCSSFDKESACHAGDPGLIPGEGNGNPLQYSCLENPMDRGAWRATVHGVARVGHDLVTNNHHHQA